MDLRPYDLDEKTLELAKKYSIQGLITYQPFIYADTFETGVGMEFEVGSWDGLVYYPDFDQEAVQRNRFWSRIMVDPARYDEFHHANSRLRKYYDSIVDTICVALGGDISDLSFLDVGCKNGYFSQSIALRNAKWAGGVDRQDFSMVFDLLNGIPGTNAHYIPAKYDPMRHVIDGVDSVDVVTSLAVLCHTSDPLFHLHELGQLAKKALFVWTIVSDDEKYVVHYGEPRGDYPEDNFPICFDN